MDGASFDPFEELMGEGLAQDRLRAIADEMLGPDWFETRNPRLDWRTPREVTDDGRGEEVKQILQGIAAGVMS